jgi:hypothetical protein
VAVKVGDAILAGGDVAGILSRLARKAFEFAKSFLKPASSNPLLLLDNGFLRATPRGFESRPEPARRF